MSSKNYQTVEHRPFSVYLGKGEIARNRYAQWEQMAAKYSMNRSEFIQAIIDGRLNVCMDDDQDTQPTTPPTKTTE